MTITLDYFDTDTNPQNNRNISFIWKGKEQNMQNITASTFELNVTRNKSYLSFNMTLRASGRDKFDDTDEFGVTFDIEYKSLTKLFAKKVDELRNLKIRFDPEAGTPIKEIEDELFVLSLTDPKFMNQITNELNASQVLLSVLNYSFS